jgi:hypothetical protein
MMQKRVRLAVLLVGLLAAAAFVLSAGPQDDPSQEVAQPVLRQQTAQSADAQRKPNIASPASTATQTRRETWNEATVDIFVDPQPPRRPPVRTVRGTATASQFPASTAPTSPHPALPTEPQSPPRFALQALGQMLLDTERIAFLLGPQGPLVARAGATIEGKWVVETVTESALEVTHVDTAQRLSVPLPPTR